MKAIIPNTVISNYGGAVPIYNLIKRFGINKIIQEELGKRPQQSTYQYEDVIGSWLLTLYCFGNRLVRIENARKHLSQITGLNICSHDTVGRVMKKFATKNNYVEYKNSKQPKKQPKKYTINENDKLNNLLILITKEIGLLKENTLYTLDIDATLISSETNESELMYKGGKGYAPMVCMINKLPVYISMRSGNATAALNKRDCIERCLLLLEKHNIKIGRVRIDGAGYNLNVTSFLQSKNIKFVIGADWSDRSYKMIMDSNQWEKREFRTFNHIWNAEQCSVPFTFSRNEGTFRVVAMRVSEQIKNKEKSSKWKLKDGYFYKFVLTNDEDLNGFEIFEEYHQRGASEKNFDALKNDFGWRILPFSKLNENTVHLIMSALANNIYQAVLKVVSSKIKTITDKFRLRRFFLDFIDVACTLKKGKYKFQGDIDYHKLL